MDMFIDEQQLMKWNWSFLKTVLAVRQTGSLSAAARLLGVYHPTVYRQIQSLESDMGLKLFEKTVNGYRATAAGEKVADATMEMAKQTERLGYLISNETQPISDTIRVATPDMAYFYRLAGRFRKFRDLHPGIKLDVQLSNRFTDLQRQEADVAFRAQTRSVHDLPGINLEPLTFGIFAHTDNEIHNARSISDLQSADWIGFTEEMSQSIFARFMHDHGFDRNAVVRVNSLLCAVESVRHNLGLVMLPEYIAGTTPEIRQIEFAGTPLVSEFWLLTTQSQFRRPAIRAFFKFFEIEGGKPETAETG